MTRQFGQRGRSQAGARKHDNEHTSHTCTLYCPASAVGKAILQEVGVNAHVTDAIHGHVVIERLFHHFRARDADTTVMSFLRHPVVAILLHSATHYICKRYT